MTEQGTITSSYLFVKQSDLYPASHFRSGLFLCALVLMAVYFLPFNWEDPIWLLYIQVGAFFLGYLLAYTKRFKKLFTFKSEMREEVHQKALESLREYGLLGKKKHIFLFVSLVEKRLECILSQDLEEVVEGHRVVNVLKSYRDRLRTEKIENLISDIIKDIEMLFPTAKTAQEESPLLQQESSESQPLIDSTDESKRPEEENQTISE
jgi:uncharacterized membrane protein